MLKESQQLFGLIRQATAELNHIFSFPAFFIISTKLVTSVYCLFVFIYQILKPNTFTGKGFWMTPTSLLADLTFVLDFFTAADMPVYQVGFKMFPF